MASTPIQPHWDQPSHPLIQEVIHTSSSSSSSTDSSEGDNASFTTKSISRVSLNAYEIYAPLTFPPLTLSKVGATYATVQVGKNKHVELNSDLLFVEHSCVPSVIFDTDKMVIRAGPNGLKKGEDITFFYPSTEWEMAQGFECRCGKVGCRGWIEGAKGMGMESLERDGMWLSSHVREMLTEMDGKTQGDGKKGGSNGVEEKEKVGGDVKTGVSSRELSGEMGGDTAFLKVV